MRSLRNVAQLGEDHRYSSRGDHAVLSAAIKRSLLPYHDVNKDDHQISSVSLRRSFMPLYFRKSDLKRRRSYVPTALGIQRKPSLGTAREHRLPGPHEAVEFVKNEVRME